MSVIMYVINKTSKNKNIKQKLGGEIMKQLCEIAERLRLKATETCDLCGQIKGQIIPLNVKDQLIGLARESQSIASEFSGEINARENSQLRMADIRSLKQAI